MVVETEPLILVDWLPKALLYWLIAVSVATLAVGTVIAAIALARDGWARGLDTLARQFVAVVDDLLRCSPRRVWALARLTAFEAWRRRGWMGLVIFFLLVLPLALWFLDRESPDPAALYISAVQWATTVLVLATVLLLACTSLPNEVRQKTVQTLVTKPVRASEIVAGRIVGVVLIGTAMLAVMGLFSFTFVTLALDHQHELDPKDVSLLTNTAVDDPRAVRQGRTSRARHHRHTATIDADGRGATDLVQGHWHRIETVRELGVERFAVGGPLGQFRARVPVYGSLRFRRRDGTEKDRGVILDYWQYRSYIDGGTLASATWTFDGVTSARFPQGLPVDLNLLVFRTHKGDIESGITGSVQLRNPRTQRVCAPINFVAREFTLDSHLIPRRLTDPEGKAMDLFDELVDDGRIELVLQCLEEGQFFGAARADVYLLAREGSVVGNFLLAYIGLWLQMILVASVGVMWSTFLNAAVALLATVGSLFVGYNPRLIEQLSSAKAEGGRTFESLLRIVEHKNLFVELEESRTLTLVHYLDEVVRWGMWLLSRLAPDLRDFGRTDYLVYGYAIGGEDLLIHAIQSLGYVLPMLVVGCLCFKFREAAQ